MSCRSLARWVTLAALVGGAPPVAGQAGAVADRMRAADVGPPGLGPDGHPDLQGVWLNNSATPLERPKLLEGRTSLTDEEVAELRRRADRLFKNTNADFAAGDAVYLAALADIDRFKSTTSTGSTFEMIEREFDNRTSLIVDPPDGRIPPLTREACRDSVAPTPAPVHSGTTRSCKRPGTSCCSSRRYTKRGSSLWTGARICRHRCVSGRVIRGDDGTARRS